MALYKMVSE